MTRTETLALYRPIRATIRRIISLAVPACARADFMRAAKQLGLWADGAIVYPDDKAAEMLGDVALFESNQRGRRAFDRKRRCCPFDFLGSGGFPNVRFFRG